MSKGYAEFIYKIKESKEFNYSFVANDLMQQYDCYYKENKNKTSIYDSRFKKYLMPLRCKKLIKNTIIQNIKKKIKESDNKKIIDFSILDFGCGNGVLYQECLKEVNNKQFKKKINFRITCFDISIEAIKSYAKKLEKDNFVKINKKREEKTPYCVHEFHKNNCHINFVYGNVSNSIEELGKVLLGFDTVLVIYGVINHIPCRKNRQNLTKFFSDISRQCLLMTIAGSGSYKNEVKSYNTLRKNKVIYKMAVEDGDIYYPRIKNDQKLVENYYHIYSPKEMLQDLKVKLDNINNKKITTSIVNIKSNAELSTSYLKNKLDSFFIFCLNFLPYFIRNRFNRYFYLKIDKK